MEIIIYSVAGIVFGFIVGWLMTRMRLQSELHKTREQEQQKFSELEKAFTAYKATSEEQLLSSQHQAREKQQGIDGLRKELQEKAKELVDLSSRLSDTNARLNASRETVGEKQEQINALKEEFQTTVAEFDKARQLLATANADNKALAEKLETQQTEIEKLGEKFNLEFENIANKILETKTEKFTELNKTNLRTILEPLGKNISDFKTKVEEVYDKEAKERFSLGEKVKELAELNQLISEEAQNLTRALKGEAKTQGGWGEMILESILEKSGLRKGQEYFMEHQLTDEEGNPLKSDKDGKKMRPDAVIKYPDNRSVIIDSKVSINAFERYLNATDAKEQEKELNEHVAAVKHHINDLSAKGYDDYNKALDFVMMFIPSEPAYIAALQGDPNLWNYAYDKRILLLNPTNMITSLKLIVDLWKREYQNRNAIEIADRGAKLYDKFKGFVDNLKGVGDYLDKAQGKYTEAYKQLSSGRDNLVLQATKLKSLGLKTRKSLAEDMIEEARESDLLEDPKDD
jgi:DNA recombination protein RmuC